MPDLVVPIFEYPEDPDNAKIGSGMGVRGKAAFGQQGIMLRNIMGYEKLVEALFPRLGGTLFEKLA